MIMPEQILLSCGTIYPQSNIYRTIQYDKVMYWAWCAIRYGRQKNSDLACRHGLTWRNLSGPKVVSLWNGPHCIWFRDQKWAPKRKCPIAMIISWLFRNYIEIWWKAPSHALRDKILNKEIKFEMLNCVPTVLSVVQVARMRSRKSNRCSIQSSRHTLTLGKTNKGAKSCTQCHHSPHNTDLQEGSPPWEHGDGRGKANKPRERSSHTSSTAQGPRWPRTAL